MDVIDNVPLPRAPPRMVTVTAESCSSLPLLAEETQFRRPELQSECPVSMFGKPFRSSPPRFLVLCLFLAGIVALQYFVENASPVWMRGAENALRNRSPSGPYTDVVRFMTLNTFIRPIGVGFGDYKDRRLHDLLQELGSFDIICFQELFTSSGSRKVQFLRKLEQYYGFSHHVSAPTPGFRGLLSFPPKIIDGGLVIASRFEIIQTDYHTYSRANIESIDFIVGKGVLYARVALPMLNSSKCLMHVFTTHMQANNGLDVDFATVRQSQLQELAAFVADKTSDDPAGPILLAGDFNVDGRRDSGNGSSSAEYVQMMNVLHKVRSTSPLRDLLYEVSGNMHPVTSAGGLHGDNQKNERLDYIFFSSNNESEARSPCLVTDISSSVHVEPWKISGRPYRTLSDHYAVVANFKIEQMGNHSINS